MPNCSAQLGSSNSRPPLTTEPESSFSTATGSPAACSSAPRSSGRRPGPPHAATTTTTSALTGPRLLLFRRQLIDRNAALGRGGVLRRPLGARADQAAERIPAERRGE